MTKHLNKQANVSIITSTPSLFAFVFRSQPSFLEVSLLYPVPLFSSWTDPPKTCADIRRYEPSGFAVPLTHPDDDNDDTNVSFLFLGTMARHVT